jgi:hypothetical protein
MAFLNDGHPTTIGFAQAGILFREKELNPPGMDGNGPNDTTTMRNVAFRTKQPKHLITATAMKVKVSYDPAFYGVIVANININQPLTVNFPDGSVLGIFGWLDKFIPDTIKEGEQPTAEITIEPSNQDNTGVEQAPTFTPAP